MTKHAELRGRLTAETVTPYLLGGKGTVTLHSGKSGKYYTYRVSDGRRGAPDGSRRLLFVNLLTGPDNGGDYSYVGIVPLEGQPRLVLTRKSKMKDDSPPVRAFRFMLECARRGKFPPGLVVWHEGRCGRCGRKLTTPDSARTGIGPICRSQAA